MLFSMGSSSDGEILSKLLGQGVRQIIMVKKIMVPTRISAHHQQRAQSFAWCKSSLHDIVLSQFHTLTQCSQQPYEVNTVILFLLSKVKDTVTQGHTGSQSTNTLLTNLHPSVLKSNKSTFPKEGMAKSSQNTR